MQSTVMNKGDQIYCAWQEPDAPIKMMGLSEGKNIIRLTYRDPKNTQDGFATTKILKHLEGDVVTPRGDWGGRSLPCTIVIDCDEGRIEVER